MPSGSSWQAVPVHSTMQNYTLPIFQVTFQLHPNTFLGWNNKSMSKSKSSSRCLQEAFDKLLQHTFQHWCQLTSFVSWWKVWKNRGEKNFRFWTIHDISCRCIQEAVDELFQHTPKWKNTHSLCFKLVFNSTQALFWDEITSLWLNVRLPPDASRKQLTSCCSTPSIMSANKLHFSNEEKSRSLGMKK